MPSSFLTNCFGKSKPFYSSFVSVTEVKTFKQSQEKCPTYSFEVSLQKAERSKSISTLETAISRAEQSGLIPVPETFAKHKQRLKMWKSSCEDIINKSEICDEAGLSHALKKFADLSLVDEEGCAKYGEIVLYFLQAKNKLNEAIDLQSIEVLEKAFDEYLIAQKKLETYRGQKNIDSILLTNKQDVESADNLLQLLKLEAKAFKKDPNFPKSKIINAIEERNIIELQISTKRWKRLGLDLLDKNFVEANKLLEQLLQQKKDFLMNEIELKLKERDLRKIQELLSSAKEVSMEPHLLEIFENWLIPTLRNFHERAKLLILYLTEQNYEDLEDALLAAERFPEKSKLNNWVNFESCQQCKSDSSIGGHPCFSSSSTLERLKSEIETILTDSRRIFKVARCIVDSHAAMKISFSAVKITVSKILTILNNFVNEHCGGSCLIENQPMLIRRSLLHSPKDRLVISREIVLLLSNLPEMLSSAISSSRHNIKTFENAQRQADDEVKLWNDRNKQVAHSTQNESRALFKDTIHDAENVLDIINRLIAVAKAENSLTFFESSSSFPRDQTEVENILVHIKEGLKVLSESSFYKSKESNFVDLWYNRPENSEYFLNKEKFHNTILTLHYFSKLFPEQMIISTKKAAEIQLVELQLFRAEAETKVNSSKYALNQAITSMSERELVKALQNVPKNHLSKNSTFKEADRELTKLRIQKSLCRERLRVAIGKKEENELENALSQASEFCLAATDSVYCSAKRTLEEIQFFKKRQTAAILDLQHVVGSFKTGDIRFALARAKVCKVSGDNPAFLKAQQSLSYSYSLKKFEVASETQFIESLRTKMQFIEKDPINFVKTLVPKFPLCNVQQEIENTITNERFIQCLRNITDRILHENFAEIHSAYHLQILLKFAEHEKTEIPSGLFNDSRRAMAIINDQQNKAVELKYKLEEAITENRIDKLAAAITSAESESKVVQCGVSENIDELIELTMQAKEKFALVCLHQNSDEEKMIRKHIISARKQLKKAIAQETRISPLKEAVETFRLICSSISPRVLDEVDKHKKENKLRELNSSKLPIFVSKQTFKKTINFQKQSRNNFLEKSKPLGTFSNPENVFKFKPLKARNIYDLNRSKSASAIERKKSNKKFLHQPEKRRFHSLSSLEQKPRKDINKRQKYSDKTKQESNPTTKLKNEVSFATAKSSASQISSVPAIKLAWLDLEEKNIELLRRAERNLKKMEKREEKRKEDENKEKFLNNIKDDLLANLQSSVHSGDRAELWQAVHEYQRYFGGEETNEIFNQAKIALRVSTFSQYKENLSKAVAERNYEKLDHVIYEIEHDTSDYLPSNEEEKKSFFNNIKAAKNLASHLHNLQNYRETVMTVTRSHISEINSYSSPPNVIKSVMAATYLLLGESEATVKNWKKVHALIGRLGQLALTRRVLRCIPENVSVEACKKASLYLEDLNHERVRSISVGASIFYSWSKCMIYDVCSRQGEHLMARKQKEETPKTSRGPPPEFWQRLAQTTKPATPKYFQDKNKLLLSKRPRAQSAKV